jgi:hypothetical protein
MTENGLELMEQFVGFRSRVGLRQVVLVVASGLLEAGKIGEDTVDVNLN